MRRLLTGCLVTLLLLCNTLILFGPLMLFALLKLISPGRLRDYNSRAVMWIAETWSEIDKRIFALCLPTHWDIRGAEGLSRDTSYLLKPKAGGVAFVLAAMGEQLDAVLDVTVVYPQAKIPGFWDLISGQVPKVIVDIQTRELDPALWQGDYENDPVFREVVQSWVNQLWIKKDQRISTLRAERS